MNLMKNKNLDVRIDNIKREREGLDVLQNLHLLLTARDEALQFLSFLVIVLSHLLGMTVDK